MKGSQGKNSGRNRIEAGEGLCLLACSPWLAWFSFNFLSFFVFKFVRTWFLGSHGYPGTYSVDQAVLNLSASASQVLGFKLCATTCGYKFLKVFVLLKTRRGEILMSFIL